LLSGDAERESWGGHWAGKMLQNTTSQSEQLEPILPRQSLAGVSESWLFRIGHLLRSPREIGLTHPGMHTTELTKGPRKKMLRLQDALLML
jgi:hypothetical protein